jgi:transcriptional regulator with XRE-family HTH domain
MSTSIAQEFTKIYQAAENKEEIDYWAPFSRIIVESLEMRHLLSLSQEDLAQKMGSRQSVISRFENMGRKPNYDFIARMSFALGHVPGMTLFGDYMTVVPSGKQALVKSLAERNGMPINKYVGLLLEKAIAEEEAITRRAEFEAPLYSTTKYSNLVFVLASGAQEGNTTPSLINKKSASSRIKINSTSASCLVCEDGNPGSSSKSAA